MSDHLRIIHVIPFGPGKFNEGRKLWAIRQPLKWSTMAAAHDSRELEQCRLRDFEILRRWRMIPRDDVGMLHCTCTVRHCASMYLNRYVL